MNLHFAPVQGHTDAAYRHFHSKVYGDGQTYYTPFIRLEKDSVRPRDIKDFTSELNENLTLIPQVIFKDKEELEKLILILKNKDEREINLNMGCPFPLQTGHGRGAATVDNKQLASDIADIVNTNPDISFSVKMRLGLKSPDEWKTIMPYLNSCQLKHITLHPRIGRQQYSGDLDMLQFADFYKESRNPVIFNGDIKKPEEVNNVLYDYSDIGGIMIGRGALGRPSIFREISESKIWDREMRLEKMLEFHRLLFNHYSQVLCGDTQVITKIKPFWEFAEEEIGRKAWKAIKKASNISKYQTAVAMI